MEEGAHLIASKTRQRCPRCSNVLSNFTICFLSSGSACLNLLRICTSFSPARYLRHAFDDHELNVDKKEKHPHRLLASYNFNRHLLANIFSRNNPSPDDICKHALSDMRIYLVPSIKLFPKYDRIITLRVGCGIESSRDKSWSSRFLKPRFHKRNRTKEK